MSVEKYVEARIDYLRASYGRLDRDPNAIKREFNALWVDLNKEEQRAADELYFKAVDRFYALRRR